MLKKFRDWADYRGVSIPDLIKVSFAMLWLMTMVGFGIYAILV